MGIYASNRPKVSRVANTITARGEQLGDSESRKGNGARQGTKSRLKLDVSEHGKEVHYEPELLKKDSRMREVKPVQKGGH
jgi:hypothetical protein